MTTGNALAFIERGLTDTDLRKRLNSAADINEVNAILKEEELVFTPHQFDEAYHNRLTKCQGEEESEIIKEFKMWWEILNQIFGTNACAGDCSGCSC